MLFAKSSEAGQRQRSERGAALVEAVLIIPIILALTFGAIEFGFAFNEQGNIRAATRTAARAASTQPKAPAADFEMAAVDTLNASVKNLTNGVPEFALIYKETGTPPTAPAQCGANCRVYNWSPGSGTFVPGGGSGWPPESRSACAGSSDRVGVFLKVDHKYMTGLWGDTGIGLTSRTVMALEPHPGADCAAVAP